MPTAPPIHNRNVAGKVHGEAYNRQRTRGLHTGSKTWHRLRREVLARDLYLCQECGRYGNEVDHVDGDSHNNEADNLQTLCKACHATKTGAETGRVSMLPVFDRPPRVPVVLVAGPPGSGKTTYARSNAGPRDMILDLDEIAAELSGVSPHETPDDKVLMWRAIGERNKRLARLATSPGCERCWFVAMAPRLQERRHWRQQLKASVVVLATSQDECLRRIAADQTRGKKEREFWERIVRKWWKSYTAEAQSGDEEVIHA